MKLRTISCGTNMKYALNTR